MPFVYGDRRANLRGHALVGPKQRQVAVGRRAGEDLDGAGFVEVTEACDDVAGRVRRNRLETLEKVQPEDGRLCEAILAILAEVVLVFLRRNDLPLKVFGKFLLKVGWVSCSRSTGERLRLALSAISSASRRRRTASNGR